MKNRKLRERKEDARIFAVLVLIVFGILAGVAVVFYSFRGVVG